MTVVDVVAVRMVAWSVLAALVGTAVGLSAGRVVEAAVDVKTPRLLFERVVGDVVVQGRVTDDLPPAAAPECGGPAWFSGLVFRDGGFAFPVSDWGERGLRYSDDSGVAVVDQPRYAGGPDAPLAVYLVHVGEPASEVRATFGDGSTDAMRPVEGWAVLLDRMAREGDAEDARFEIIHDISRSLAVIDVPPSPGATAVERCLVER